MSQSQRSGPALAGSARVFLRRFFRSPAQVGSIAPSSRFLARRMVQSVRWVPGVRVVEFGPGTGPFTHEILRRLPEDGKYVGIDLDPVFIDMLRRRFPDGDFHCGRVEDLVDVLDDRNWQSVDHIVSGIPFASLPPATIPDIIDAARGSLAPGGSFTTFQYLHSYWLPSARAFRREVRRRFDMKRATRVEFRNLPPAFVFSWITASS